MFQLNPSSVTAAVPGCGTEHVQGPGARVVESGVFVWTVGRSPGFRAPSLRQSLWCS